MDLNVYVIKLKTKENTFIGCKGESFIYEGTPDMLDKMVFVDKKEADDLFEAVTTVPGRVEDTPEDFVYAETDLEILPFNLKEGDYMEDGKLRPDSGGIKVTYTIKEHPEYGEKHSHHRTYEDVGEWICRQFSKINIIDVDDKES